MKTIYFDYNATTPLDPAVRDAMLPYLDEIYGNPSSVHHIGRRARALLDDARDRVARSGAVNQARSFLQAAELKAQSGHFGSARLLRHKGRHLITSSIEHHAVLRSFQYLEKFEGFSVTYLPPDRQGLVSARRSSNSIRPDTVLVSIMTANNETGAIQPVARFGEICRQRGVLFHTDAVQSFGKQPFSEHSPIQRRLGFILRP